MSCEVHHWNFGQKNVWKWTEYFLSSHFISCPSVALASCTVLRYWSQVAWPLNKILISTSVKEFHCCAGNPKTMSSMLTRAISRTFTLGSMTDGSSSTLQVRTFTVASMAGRWFQLHPSGENLHPRLHDRWFRVLPSGENLHSRLHDRWFQVHPLDENLYPRLHNRWLYLQVESSVIWGAPPAALCDRWWQSLDRLSL